MSQSPTSGHFDAATHHLPVRVYYEDTDAGGIVYHASYVRFLERGRTEFLRHLGVHQSALMAAGPASAGLLVVRHMTLDFRQSARLDDALTVTTAVGDLTGARLILDQAVMRAGTVLVAATVTVAMIGADGRPRRIGAELRAAFGAATAKSSAPAQ